MWFAKHFPGLRMDVNRYGDDFTPEQTAALAKAGHELLEAEAKERLSHTKAVMAAAAGRRLL